MEPQTPREGEPYATNASYVPPAAYPGYSVDPSQQPSQQPSPTIISPMGNGQPMPDQTQYGAYAQTPYAQTPQTSYGAYAQTPYTAQPADVTVPAAPSQGYPGYSVDPSQQPSQQPSPTIISPMGNGQPMPDQTQYGTYAQTPQPPQTQYGAYTQTPYGAQSYDPAAQAYPGYPNGTANSGYINDAGGGNMALQAASFDVPDTEAYPEDAPNRKRWLLLSAAVAVPVVIAVAVFALNMKQPTSPDQVWRVGLSHTGKMVDAAINNGTSPDALKQLKHLAITGDISVKSPTVNGQGSITQQSDENGLAGSYVIDLHDDKNQPLKVTADVMAKYPDGTNLLPDGYLRLQGLANLPFDINAILPGIDQYDSKWIGISSGYLRGLFTQSTTAPAAAKVSDEDMAATAKMIADISRQYIFAASKDKAVIEIDHYDGKDVVDGTSLYHYTAYIDKTHAQNYCLALADGWYKSAVFNKITEASARSAAYAGLKKDCANKVKHIDEANTLELWIGGSDTLIRKVRVYTNGDRPGYVEYGHTYSGGDDFPVFVHVRDDAMQIDTTLNATVNIKTYGFKGNFVMKSDKPSESFEISGHINGAASDKPAQIDIPTNAVKVQDVLDVVRPPDDTSSGGDVPPDGDIELPPEPGDIEPPIVPGAIGR